MEGFEGEEGHGERRAFSDDGVLMALLSYHVISSLQYQ